MSGGSSAALFACPRTQCQRLFLEHTALRQHLQVIHPSYKSHDLDTTQTISRAYVLLHLAFSENPLRLPLANPKLLDEPTIAAIFSSNDGSRPAIVTAWESYGYFGFHSSKELVDFYRRYNLIHTDVDVNLYNGLLDFAANKDSEETAIVYVGSLYMVYPSNALGLGGCSGYFGKRDSRNFRIPVCSKKLHLDSDLLDGFAVLFALQRSKAKRVIIYCKNDASQSLLKACQDLDLNWASSHYRVDLAVKLQCEIRAHLERAGQIVVIILGSKDSKTTHIANKLASTACNEAIQKTMAAEDVCYLDF